MQKKWWVWLGLGIIFCGLTGFGYWLYDSQLQRSLLPIHERLNNIARLKADQINAWRQERLGDAEMLRVNAPLARAIRNWLENKATAGQRAEVVDYLERMCRQFHYAGFLLVDAQGGIRHSSLELDTGRLDAEGLAALTGALRERRAIMSDIHTGTDFPYPHLSVMAPYPGDHDAAPVGAILMLIDARTDLFPLLQAWPGLSASGEIALIRRDGDAAMFLSNLRHRPDSALKLRLPLSQRDLPAARLILGERGAIEGRDYRGMPVLVAGMSVPGTPWIVAAKMDAQEILAPARREAMIPLGAMIIAILLLSGLGRQVWSRRQRQHAASLRRLDIERLASLQKFENLFEQSLDGILLLTTDHRFLDANPAALRMLGYDRDELLRLRLPAILAQAEQARLAVEIPIMMAGTPHLQEWRHVRKNGTTFIGAVTAKALDDERYFATLRDITEQKQREALEQARTRVLDLMTKNAPLPALLEILVTAVEASHPGMLCGILLLDETGQRLIQGAAPSLPDFYNQAVDGIEIGPCIGCCGAAAYTGQRVIAGDIQTHPNWGAFREVAARAGLGACWSEPIQSSAGKVLGTFAIYHHEPEEPGPAEIQLIEQSASLAAIILERSRVGQALALSEQRYALANRATSNIIWDWDLSTGRVWWNDNFYTLLGDSRETTPPCYEEWMRRLHPEDQPDLLAQFEAALADDATEWNGAYRLRHQSGDYVEFEDHCHIQRDAKGQALRLVGAMQDVTQRNAAERRARESADRYQRMLQASKDGFWLVDAATGRLLDVNQAACDLSGYTREELLSMAILDFDVNHDSALVRERTQRLLDAGGGLFETRHRTRDGRLLDVEISVIADAGSRLFLSFIRDVTERKRTEQALKLTQFTIDRATDAVFWIRENGSFAYVNEAACRSLEYEREELLKLGIADIDPVYPLDTWPEHWLALQSNALPVTETVHRTRSGHEFAVEISCSFLRFEGEHYVAAFVRNVSERKRQEQSLRFSQFALESATDAVYWIHPDGSIFYVNEAACQMLGYSREELQSMAVSDLNSEFADAAWDAHWADLKEHGAARLETTHRARDGRVIPVEIAANFIQHEGCEYNCAIVRDITERNRMLEAVRVSEKQLRRESERNRYLLQAATDGIHVVDDQGRIILANRAFADSLGYPAGGAVGLHVTDFDAVFSLEQLARNLPEWLAREHPFTFETRHRRRNGEVFDVEVTACAVTLDGRQMLFASSRDITARKASEEALRKLNEQLEQRVAERTAELNRSEERLLMALEATHEGLWDWNLLTSKGYCSPAYYRLLGYEPVESGADMREHFSDLLHPEDRDRVLDQIGRAIQETGEFEIEFRMRTHEGDYRWILSQGHVVEHGPQGEALRAVGTHTDITPRKQAELALAESHERLRKIAVRMPGFIYQYQLRPDGSSCFPYASDGILQLFRVTPEQVREDAAPLFAMLHPEDHADVVASIQESARTLETWRCEFRVRYDDGAVRWLYGNSAPELLPDGSILWHGYVYDISERKQAEEQIHELNTHLERKVEERTAQLAAASAAKSQFLAHMSHEIRTPMNAVLGLTQLLAQEPLTPGQAAMVRHIGEAGDSLLRILNDILDFSKIEAGQVRIETQPFTLSSLLHHIDSLMRPTATGKGLVLSINGPPCHQGTLVGDQVRLEQVLINLVGNAIKFTTKGTVDVAVIPRLDEGHKVRLRFTVRDTGLGLSPEAQARLFQPFSQGDASITRRFGGTGLGLSISLRLVELMGGEMGVSSQEGQGSTFWFEVPFVRSKAEEAPEAASPLAVPETMGPQLTGLRVLAVDDNRINLVVLDKALKKEGAQVTLAADGQQAVQILLAQPRGFDVVLMDIQMPVMDGLTATREIRRDPALRELPVIALTAGVLPEERQAALDAGMNGFLTKPLDLNQLRDTLARYQPKDRQDLSRQEESEREQEAPST